MRWNAKPIPEFLQQRTVTRFAWLPTRIGDEVLWLERYLEVQEWVDLHNWEGIHIRKWMPREIRIIQPSSHAPQEPAQSTPGS